MQKLPLLRQGQAFDYKVINQIISAINESIIDQPKYHSMMNDLAAVTNNYTTSIESFISRYKDVVENTPTLHELLVAYAALQDKANGPTQAAMVNVPYVNLQFIHNPSEETGFFELVGNTPNIGDVAVENGQCVIAGKRENGEFADTKIFVNCGTKENPHFFCLDVIRGPQGPAGQQGNHGATGDKGEDGKDGRLVKIKGKIELKAGEQIGTILAELENKLTEEENIGDGWVYDNAEGGPVVYVYVGNDAIGVESEYEKFITIKTLRGPAGPTGPASEIDIRFSREVGGPGIKYDEIEKNDEGEKLFENYYFMWIRVLTADMTDTEKNNIPYSKIRIKQRDLHIEPYVSFTYEVKNADGTYDVVQTEGKKANLIEEVSTDTTDTKKFIFEFNDQIEISKADFDEDGHIVFEREYVNAGAPADPLKTKGRVHTPTLYFDGSTYSGEKTLDADIVKEMADDASIKYRSFAIYKTPDGQDLQIWEINLVDGDTQVTKRSSLFMNIISKEGVWSTQQGDKFIPLKADGKWDARSIPDFQGPTTARPVYGENEDGDPDYSLLCFNGKELFAGDNYLVAKAFNFYDESRDASICEAYISDGNQWIKILETQSVRGDKQFLKIQNNKLYHAYIRHDQTFEPSNEELIELFDFSSVLNGLDPEDIETLKDLIGQFEESGFNTLVEAHNESGNAHQDIRNSINNHTHGIDKVDGLQTALEGKADSLHTHAGYVTTRTLDEKNYVDDKELTSEVMDQIRTHDGRTDAHQDIRDSLEGKANASHTHTFNDIEGSQDKFEEFATKTEVNGMFSYNSSTKTLTITSLTT